MGLFSRVVVTSSDGASSGSTESRSARKTPAGTVAVEVERAKLWALAGIVVAFGILATVLFLADKNAGATAMAGMATTVLGGGFGIVAGEKSAVSDVVRELTAKGMLS